MWIFPLMALALVLPPVIAIGGTGALVLLKVWFAISWGWALSPLLLLVPWAFYVWWLKTL